MRFVSAVALATVMLWVPVDGVAQVNSRLARPPLTEVLERARSTKAQITTGEFHTCALKVSGRAFCWGDNSQGQVGDGTQERRPVAAPVSGTVRRLTPGGQSVGLALSVISAGNWHTCGLTRTGEAYCWGSNIDAQLGDGKTDTLSYHLEPIQVSGILAFDSISAGGYHTCALTPAGKAYCWGLNHGARLGLAGYGRPNPYFRHRSEPTAVAGDLTFTSISAGEAHTCGVTTNGAAYCWGYNLTGQHGEGTYATHSAPFPVSGELSFASISSGADHTCGITTDGSAYCWGDNSRGQIGNGTTTGSRSQWDELPHRTPTPVAGVLAGGVLSGEPGGRTVQGDVVSFESIAVGYYYACGIATNGAAYCWGHGSVGQLGYFAFASHGAPVAVADW